MWRSRAQSDPSSHRWVQRGLWHGLILAVCLAPSLVVGIEGLSRPYDAIPDQDLLWASEALRLIRGVAPSYADHPGAFWTLVYQLNIHLAELLTGGAILDHSDSITPEGIILAVQTARIENAIACGLCGYLVSPVAESVGIRRWLAASLAIITSLSSAVLVGVSEIRHEVISTAFLLMMIIAFSAAMQSKEVSTKRLLAITSVAFYFCAAFAKNQSLLLTPLAFLAIAAIATKQGSGRLDPKRSTKLLLSKETYGFASLASLPWLINAFPDIDLINLPFWAMINTGLALIMAASWCIELNWQQAYKALAALGVAQIVLFKAVSPQWWRQGVTGFPSWMLRHANAAENKNIDITGHTFQGIHQYFANLFEPESASLIAFTVAIVITCISLALICIRRSHTGTIPAIQSFAWLSCGFALLACSQRIQSRYEIYIFIPIVMCAGVSVNTVFIGFSALKPRKAAIELLLAACSITLISTGTFQSLANAFNLKHFINTGQPRDVLCIGHHMDRTMHLTSAGACEVFPNGALDKNAYDSWWGPGR
jgi:hypothetical protein